MGGWTLETLHGLPAEAYHVLVAMLNAEAAGRERPDPDAE